MATKKKSQTKKKPAAKKAAPKKGGSKKAASKKASNKAGKKAPPKKAPPKKAAKKAAKQAAPKRAAQKAPKRRASKPAKKAPPQKPVSQKPVSQKLGGPNADKKAAVSVVEKRVEKKAPSPPDPVVDLAQAVAALALEKKAEELLILKVTDLTSYADCFILASAPSERQVQAIARFVADEMRKAGKTPVGSEGLEQGHWVLVDLGAAVLHVFLSTARHYYDLEGFWSDAPRVEVDEAYGKEILSRMAAAYEERRAVNE